MREGLKRLHRTANLGMRALILQNQLTPEQITSYHIGFVLGPCVNASGRLETAKIALNLFLQKNEIDAGKIAKELVELNAQRKSMTADGVELAKQIGCEKKQIIVGYRNDETFLKTEFEQNGEVYISTEDGSAGTKGNVMDAIRENGLEADIIYACGPTPMLRAIKNYAEENGIECYISLEERMACGIGACLACVCKTKEKDHHSNVHNKRICKDGPVFLSTEVEI